MHVDPSGDAGLVHKARMEKPLAQRKDKVPCSLIPISRVTRRSSVKETGAEVDFPDRVQGQLRTRLRPDPGLLPSTTAALPLAGVVAGVALYNKIQADIPAHRGLGIFVLFLGILQVRRSGSSSSRNTQKSTR